jgi:hypothetical protein
MSIGADSLFEVHVHESMISGRSAKESNLVMALGFNGCCKVSKI